MENSSAARGKAFSASVSATLTCRRQLSVVRKRLFRAAAQPFLWGGRDRLKVRKRLFRNAERTVSPCCETAVVTCFCAMDWLSVIYQKGTIPAYLHWKVLRAQIRGSRGVGVRVYAFCSPCLCIFMQTLVWLARRALWRVPTDGAARGKWRGMQSQEWPRLCLRGRVGHKRKNGQPAVAGSPPFYIKCSIISS